jgi:broad specificity phosphatase PhoE
VTRLILIRRGQTDWNLAGRYQGQSDLPLNQHGREQALQIARSLDGTGLSAIYASDLARARDTAQILARAAGLKVQLDPWLREINQGEWEGMLFAEIQARYPQELKRRRESPLDFAPPGGETVQEVRERVLSAVPELVHRHPDQTLAIVSHGLALAIVRAHYENHPIEQVWELIPGNGETIEVEIR